MLLAQANDHADQRFQFTHAAGLQVALHGGPDVRRAGVNERERLATMSASRSTPLAFATAATSTMASASTSRASAPGGILQWPHGSGRRAH